MKQPTSFGFVGMCLLSTILFASAAHAGEFELRAGYGLAGSSSQSASASGSLVSTSAHGFVVSALLSGPDNFIDFGLQYEQLSPAAPNGGLTGVFQRLALVLEKKVWWRSFFLAPNVGVGFLNVARYSTPSQQVWRASEPLTFSGGLGLGARFSWVGVVLEGGYRWARLTQANNSVTNQDVSGRFLPDWSSAYFRTSVAVWF